MDKYLKFLEHQSACAQQEIEHWATKCIENPLHQLEWADAAFSAGGRLAAVRSLRWYVEGMADDGDLTDLIMQAVVTKARLASRSSSATKNLLNAEELKWMAVLVSEMQRLAKRG